MRVIILCHGITKHVWTLLSAVWKRWISFDLLTSFSSVVTRHNYCKQYSALATPSVPCLGIVDASITLLSAVWKRCEIHLKNTLFGNAFNKFNNSTIQQFNKQVFEMRTKRWQGRSDEQQNICIYNIRNETPKILNAEKGICWFVDLLNCWLLSSPCLSMFTFQ